MLSSQKIDRFEIKYHLDKRLLPNFLNYLSEFCMQDENSKKKPDGYYNVHSLYFDSRHGITYQQKINGNLERRKFRLRFYDFPISNLFFEVKKKYNLFTSKDRLCYDFKGRSLKELFSSPSPLIDDIEKEFHQKNEFFYYRHYFNLVPSTWVSYRRMAFLGKQNREIRITIDRDLRGGAVRSLSFEPENLIPLRSQLYASNVIVELKFRKALPYWMETLIRELNIRDMPISKYAMSYSASYTTAV